MWVNPIKGSLHMRQLNTMSMHLAHLHHCEAQRPIPGWSGYYVTDAGRVFSFKVQGYQTSWVDLEKEPVELRVVAMATGASKALRPVVPRGIIGNIKRGRTYREAVGPTRYSWSGQGRKPIIGQESV
jgi:hypothetical protein